MSLRVIDIEDKVSHLIIIQNFDIYKLNIQIQISLTIGNLHLAGLITDNDKKKKIKKTKKKEILYI